MSAADDIVIPEQLRECRFILVAKGEKRAIEKGWQTTANYAHDDPKLLNWIAEGGNYGVMPSSGICIVDADNALGLYRGGYLTPVLESFSVRSGRTNSAGMHFYVRCPDAPAKKFALKDPESHEDLGDVRGSGHPSFCVGPGCLHPSGKRYEIARPGAEISEVPWQDLKGTLIDPLHPPEKKTERPHHVSAGNRSKQSISDDLELRVEYFLTPVNPQHRGGEVEGIHPVHGSETGSNLTITGDNRWYCRRHNTGGGPLEALAVAEGIIDCSEAGPGCLQGHWPAVMDALKQRGYGEKLAELEGKKQKQKKERKVAEAKTERLIPVRNSAGEGFELTDAGNSDRLVHQHGRDLRYCAQLKSWFRWNGRMWEEDVKNQILCLATDTARSILQEAAGDPDPDRAKQTVKWAFSSQALAKRRNMIEGAAPYCAILHEEFDTDPLLLNLKNCTLDLSSFETREHSRDNMITKCAGIEYQPDAECPMWLRHLDLIFDGNQNLIDGFQEMCGYSLQGNNPEQVIFFLYGNGKNGKSETLKVLSHILGDYSTNIAAESLMVKRNEGPRSDLARISGARMITASEPNEGARLAESVIKQLTGDDKITVRRLYENEFEFTPGGKIWLATNHRPRIYGTDEGIWRRIWLVPFTVCIPKDRRIQEYGNVLLQEAEGIFNWCLEGFQRVQAQGRLNQYKEVKLATNQYRTESDTVRTFLADETMPDPDARISRKEMYAMYSQHCEDIGETPVGTRKFTQTLREVDYLTELKRGGNRMWRGMRWKTDDEKNAEMIQQIEKHDHPIREGGRV